MGLLLDTDNSTLDKTSGVVNNSNYKPSNTVSNVERFKNISKSELPKYSLRSAVPSVSRLYTPAFLTSLVVDYGVDKALEMYDEKFKELGLGKYAPTVTPEPTIDDIKGTLPKNTDIKKTEPIKDFDLPPESDTLVSILRNSSLSATAIAEQLENANHLGIENNKSLVNGVDNLTNTLKAQIDVLSSFITEFTNSANNTMEFKKSNQEIDIAYREQSLENEYQSNENVKALVSKLNDVGVSLKTPTETVRTKDELALTSKKLEHITFETTPIQLDNLGDEIPKLTPQEMRAVKDAVTAKKNSDENTFELDDDDIQDMFFMPDIKEIFNFNKKSDRWTEIFNT